MKRGSHYCGKDRAAICMCNCFLLKMLQFHKALSPWVLNQPREMSSASVLIRKLLRAGFPRLPGWAKHWLLWPVEEPLLQKLIFKYSTLSYSVGETLFSYLAKHDRQNSTGFDDITWSAQEGTRDHKQSYGACLVILWHCWKVGE